MQGGEGRRVEYSVGVRLSSAGIGKVASSTRGARATTFADFIVGRLMPSDRRGLRTKPGGLRGVRSGRSRASILQDDAGLRQPATERLDRRLVWLHSRVVACERNRAARQ